MPPSLPPSTSQYLQDLTRVITGLTLALQHTVSYETSSVSSLTQSLLHQNRHAFPSSLSSQVPDLSQPASSLFREGKRVFDSFTPSSSSSPFSTSSHSSSSASSAWSPYPSSSSPSSSPQSSSPSSPPGSPSSASDVVAGLQSAVSSLSSAVSSLPSVAPLLSSLPLPQAASFVVSSVLPPGVPRPTAEQINAGVQGAMQMARDATQSVMQRMQSPQSRDATQARDNDGQRASSAVQSPYPSQPPPSSSQSSSSSSAAFPSPYPSSSSSPSSTSQGSSDGSTSTGSRPRSPSSSLGAMGLPDLSSLLPPLPSPSSLPDGVKQVGIAAAEFAAQAMDRGLATVASLASQSPFTSQSTSVSNSSSTALQFSPSSASAASFSPYPTSSSTASAEPSFSPYSTSQSTASGVSSSPYPTSGANASTSSTPYRTESRPMPSPSPLPSPSPSASPRAPTSPYPTSSSSSSASSPSSQAASSSRPSSSSARSPSFPSPSSAMSAIGSAAQSAAAAASSHLQSTTSSFQKTAESFLPPLPKFTPRERKVPSTPFGRLMGFGGIAMRMVTGSLMDGAKDFLGPRAPEEKRERPTTAADSPTPVKSTSMASAMSPTAEAALRSDSAGTPKLNERPVPASAAADTPPASAAADGEAAAQSSSGLSRFMSAANTERLAEGLCRMRGAALKVGQMLSIQDDSLLPPQLQQVLNRVRDSADVMPRAQLERTLTAELGEGWEARMQSFDWAPIAAASIGQVHRGVDGQGRAVVMKVQYPGVADSIHSDVNNVRTLIRLFNVLPAGLYIDQTMQAAKEELSVECDYDNEAESQTKFKQLIEHSPLHPLVHVPKVVRELSTARVLTSEFVRGVPIDRVARDGRDALGQEERDALCLRLLHLCLLEVFDFRFMQTDPNWSNFLYEKETGVLHCIDFGASREYDKQFVDEYMRMVSACAERDRQGMLDASLKLGFLTGDESRQMLDAHVEAGFIVGEPFSAQYADGYDFARMDMGKRVSELARTMVKLRLTAPPKDSYTLHRKLSGCFLTCRKLEANIPCRQLFLDTYERYQFTS